MPNVRTPTHAEVGEISSDWSTQLPYINFKRNSCTSHKADIDVMKELRECAEIFQKRSGQQVLAGAAAGNAADCLEAGLRAWTGSGGVREDRESALVWWYRISAEPKPGDPAVPKRIRVQALGCLASAHWELRAPDETSDAWNIDSVYRAAHCANECASLGFVPPEVLMIAMQLRQLLENEQLVRQFPKEHSRERFYALEFLWEALAKRDEKMAAEREKREEKVAKAPSAYVCAAEGCGIEGTRKSALLQCAGKCPADVKPSYCSKECQRSDWKQRHKAVCKSFDGAPTSPTEESSRTPVSPEQTPVIAAPTPRTLEEHGLRDDGREVRMEIPRPGGGMTTIASRTMSPAFMKQFRDTMEKMVLEDGKSD